MPHRTARTSRARLRRRPSARWCIAVVLVAGILGQTGVGPALAYGAEDIPVVAGNRLTFPRGNVCTAGAVLRDSSLSQQITQYRRSVRYVLTAGHCGATGDQVKTGTAVLGDVVWKSSVSDLELVRVEPQRFLTFGCHATTKGPYCLPGSDYRPRAQGRILMSTPQAITGLGSFPGRNETFCTVGTYSGFMCPWSVSGYTSALAPTRGRMGATSADRILLHGDSGGPVVSRSGYVYGIVSVATTATTIPFSMAYVTMTQFQSEKPSFRLAPAG